MPGLNIIPNFWKILAGGGINLGVGGTSLGLLFTTGQDDAWTTGIHPGMAADIAAIPMSFPDRTVDVVAMDLNIGGDGKLDVVLPDKTLVATGGPTGPFQYVWVADVNTTALLGYYDYGAPQVVLDGQAFIVELSDANNRAFSISG